MEIKNRFTGETIYSGVSGMTMRAMLEAAVSSRANLSRANLSRANLSRANLSRANLYGANLSRANLYGANLYGADLSGANLYGADLSGANLSGADLSGANLSGANLYGANLSGAKIDGEEIKLEPIQVGGLPWRVLITDGYMRIGCQRHTHEDWSGFTASAIQDMDPGATKFWDQWRDSLLLICKTHASKLAK